MMVYYSIGSIIPIYLVYYSSWLTCMSKQIVFAINVIASADMARTDMRLRWSTALLELALTYYSPTKSHKRA